MYFQYLPSIIETEKLTKNKIKKKFPEHKLNE